jgi:hypothetical protein
MSKTRVVRAYELRPGDRFTYIPAQWFGPGTVTQSYGERVLLPNDAWYQDSMPLSKDGRHRVSGIWTLKFDNGKVVNPPGVEYCHCETKFRLLKRGKRSRIKNAGRPLDRSGR